MSGPRVDLDRVEDLLWLTSNGVSAEQAAARVGWTVPAAYRWAARHNHQELADALRAAYSADYRRRAACRMTA